MILRTEWGQARKRRNVGLGPKRKNRAQTHISNLSKPTTPARPGVTSYTRRFLFCHIPLNLRQMSDQVEEQWYDCEACPQTQQVCRYITHRVVGELFTQLSAHPAMQSNYFLFAATQQSIFDDVWRTTFPLGDVVGDPFLPISPLHFPPRGASAT